MEKPYCHFQKNICQFGIVKQMSFLMKTEVAKKILDSEKNK